LTKTIAVRILKSISEINMIHAQELLVAQQRSTIRDVAHSAGVSPSTVSRVLAGETRHIRAQTRERVQRAAAELDFHPNVQASALRGGRTYVIALILSDIANPFWPAFARGVQSVAHHEGYQVVLANSDWDRDTELEYLAMGHRARFDGIIINPGEVANSDLVVTEIPTVVVGPDIEFADFDVVAGDTQGGYLDALRHLADLGHRRVAHIGLLTHGATAKRRLANFQHALLEVGLPEQSEFLVAAAYTQDGGRRAMAELLALPNPPTAVLASNDQQAIGALAEAQARGVRVPHDLSIVGFDGIEATTVTTPPLTTMRVDRQSLGETAMRFLIERIEGSGPMLYRQRREPCELMVRGTTAPPLAVRPLHEGPRALDKEVAEAKSEAIACA